MNKRALLLKLAQDMRASYWFIPANMVLFAIVLAYGSEWLDHNAEILPFQFPESLIDTQVEGARSTLSTIATSVIGVTGVMFSMTIVAVSFAAGNYGPRLIGNFMRNRGNQISLGILIATFVYALLILRAVQDPSETAEIEAFVPQFSMLLAMLGCIIAVFTMIYFVHHVPETINVGNITAGLGQRLESEIKAIIDAEDARDKRREVTYPDRDPDHRITLNAAGYIRTLNYQQVEKLTDRDDWLLRIEQQPGDFVSSFTPVMSVWSHEALSNDDIAELRDCYALGTSKTEHQNVLFLVDELVEVLARALSPGVNDPFTAINCLNWMQNALSVARHHGEGLGEDGAGKHALGPRLTYDTLFERSFLASKPYTDTDELTKAHYHKLVAELKRSQ
ncbi:DUF2254 domain-containing protein [Roseovarius atlanticus]|uniref:DUF2254 domain-containing protein n=1 Tax=Roseovarius atlanticus TaxID=1641875 RepID=UPI001C982A91|nr:DUF2254 domain-containing protein [Roseovarius atlanticus]MBY5988841.1 DUF2254 domain-containing protein [Roseovarius atlanticus]MBY6124232.1 DUF2254 domain-containing protein [Roseovarius atlanticus]MBY6148727.1 DUF2254 domain-containing protein [Roseovarius atlanticus]